MTMTMEQVPQEVVQRAMADASRLSGLPLGETPQVDVYSPYTIYVNTGRWNILGAYQWEGHRIELAAPWSADNPDNYITLVHEMVHALQREFLGVHVLTSHRLIQEVERQAYAVETILYGELGVPNPRFAPSVDPSHRQVLAWETGIPWNTAEDVKRATSYATVPPRV